MRFFCTNCWAEVAESTRICPECGDDILARQTRADFVDKLIAALRHREPTTPVRAAWILGQRRERRAVPAMVNLATTASDPFIVAAAVAALARIGDHRAAELLKRAHHHPSPIVGRAASAGAA